MGINGLLINTKSVGNRKHISNYRNKTIGIDGYAWIHKSIHGCSLQLALEKNINGIIKYFERKISYLLSLKIKVIIVFDGDDIPLKKSENEERREKRIKYKEAAIKYYQQGNMEQAKKKFAMAIDVNPEMVFSLKQYLSKLFPTVQFIVAPYEADSQLAYLSIIKYIDVVITEDSDLIVFGAKLIFYKLDNNFYGIEYDQDNLQNCEELNIRKWSMDKIIQLCILSGCDYLSSPKGVGMKTAHSLLTKYNNITQIISNLVDKIEIDYYDKFMAAFLAFKYSKVYCPIKQQLVSLNQMNVQEIKVNNSFEYHAVLTCLKKFENFNFLGDQLNTEIARQIAFCEIDPKKKTKFKGIYQYNKSYHKRSLSYREKNLKKKLKGFLKKDQTKIKQIDLKFFLSKFKKKKQKTNQNLNQSKLNKDDSNIIDLVEDQDIQKFKYKEKTNINFILNNTLNTKDDKNDKIDQLITFIKQENAKRKPNVQRTLDIFYKTVNDIK